MKIGFDAKRFFFNPTGLGNYSRTLVYALSEYFPEHEYFLYSPKPPAKETRKELEARQNLILRSPTTVMYKALSAYWRSVYLGEDLEKDGLDIYHGLSHELPQNIKDKKVKSVVTIHDLIFIRMPELYPFIDRQIYKAKFKFACEAADKIIAISEQTKHDIMEFFDTREEKIEVVYQSCNPIFQQTVSVEDKDAVRQALGLPKSFILYVGALNPRKNVMNLVKAYVASAAKESHQLIIIGDGGSYKQQLQKYLHTTQLQDSVKILNKVTTQQLPAVYQMASLFVYPSLYEGFGIPIIEALYSKTPVITSKGSCLAEAGGPDSIYIDSTSIEELKASIENVLANVGLAKHMAEQGYQFVQRFNARQFATDTLQVYRQLT